MCGRFTLHTEKELLQRSFAVDLSGFDLAPCYNVAPTQDVLTVRQKQEQRVARYMRWGLVPRWAKPLARLPSMINARVETIDQKPAYRDAFRRRRCLVLADGFYEWQSLDKRGPRQPFWVTRADRAPFAMAGIWDVWKAPDEPDDEPLVTCSIVTAPANLAVQMIHTRMPVILSNEHAFAWIDHEFDDRPEELRELLVPIEAAELQAHPVSTEVNKTDHDHAKLIEPVENPTPTLF